MRVEVIVDQFGRYVKGDVFIAHASTGKALIAHKKVKETDNKLFCKLEDDAEKAALKQAKSDPKTSAEKVSKEEALGLKNSNK